MDKYIKMLATQRGHVSVDGTTSGGLPGRLTSNGGLNTEHLFEVVHAYRRLADEDGVPGICL